ncbi:MULTISPECIES: family 2A encapsulin nanocompartment cargo protein cysteine desulfurase [Methylotenera]|uniref:family 2A encapsulin nanocompartment cargo protein cysteine desulfurase n=1 Tax=Methylotenera TaxID=359407 RepID=UPI00035F91B2|nr:MULTISPECIES: family 2A encapsulin nanocompartment cargo protein cysteine desulfurase [Methylotenera]
MTTNNINQSNGFNLASAHDLSSFEPEAILAAIPGEHPRAGTALALGREASQTGHLDVAELSRIASEIYAEGFPAGAFGNPSTEIPSTASLSDARESEARIPVNKVHPYAVPDLKSFGITPDVEASPFNRNVTQALDHAGLADLSAAYLQNAPNLQNQVEVSQLLGGIDVPYQSQLNGLLANINTSSAGSKQPENSSYYFLQGLPSADYSPATPNQAFATSAHPAFNADLVRKDFPILNEQVNGRPLIWFDNAATTQKPQVVIDRLAYFYAHENSNIHRAAHELAARATDAYEDARETVRRFINAPSVDNIIFVRGTTEAINLVAKTWGKKHLSAGDEIVISHLEHHANIVPWQQLCQETGAKLKVIPVDNSGQVLLNEYQNMLTPKVKLVSFTQVSNALGTVTPAAQMIQMAHNAGAKVLLDGAQSVSHMRTDVQGLDPDFFVFSGHKVFGPTGIGVLYGKPEVLNDMPAWQGGGNMIQDVTFDKTVYHEAPAKFEAGTGNIADAVGLGAALEYVERIGIDNIARYEHELLVYATAALSKVPGLRLIGTAQDKASVLSFTLNGYKSEEVGAALNQEGIAVRSGHHCAQPILRRFGVETTVRPSLAFYNTYAEIDVLTNALLRLSSHKTPNGL